MPCPVRRCATCWTCAVAPSTRYGSWAWHRVRRSRGTWDATTARGLGVLLVEPEFGRLLTIMNREGSTLSAVLRNAWDGVPLGHARARDESLVARHHVVDARTRHARRAAPEADRYGCGERLRQPHPVPGRPAATAHRVPGVTRQAGGRVHHAAAHGDRERAYPLGDGVRRRGPRPLGVVLRRAGPDPAPGARRCRHGAPRGAGRSPGDGLRARRLLGGDVIGDWSTSRRPSPSGSSPNAPPPTSLARAPAIATPMSCAGCAPWRDPLEGSEAGARPADRRGPRRRPSRSSPMRGSPRSPATRTHGGRPGRIIRPRVQTVQTVLGARAQTRAN